MHAAGKVLIGLILIAMGLGLFLDEIRPILDLKINWLSNFIIVLTGVIPILLILIGLFVVWLEVDELKVQKELRKSEKQPAPKTKKK